MKRSSVKELLIFVLWVLTDIFGAICLVKADLANYFPHFALSVVVLFETYIFFQLPGAKYFWNAAEYGEDPNHGKIRLAVMAGVVAFLIFALKWSYFLALYFIATIRIDGIINFFRVSHEEKHRIFETEGIPELKTYLYILAGFPIAVALFAAAFLVYISNLSPKPSVKTPNSISYKSNEELIESQRKGIALLISKLEKRLKEVEKKKTSAAQDSRKTKKVQKTQRAVTTLSEKSSLPKGSVTDRK